jgi:hydroxymethylbilane synthase
VRLATRGSPLARWQAEWVAARLPGAELVIVETTGDRRQDVSLTEIGGQGVFVKEVQAAVLEGRADAAVHSAKDLPSVTAPGLRIAAIPERGDPRDALVGGTLDTLPGGALIATGSVRRRAQLSNRRPDLTFVDLRGNIATRLQKASSVDAIVVAVAALQRLGLGDRITEALDDLVPQAGQGAIAVECRVDDEETIAALEALDDAPTRAAVEAERSFLATLGGGCTLPAGAYAHDSTLTGLIASYDGRICLRHRATGGDPDTLGRAVADHLLHDAGGAELLGITG